ncbi:hypothetical protein [Clostridium sp. BNL1100]|uniref:hypothetical protein n=1 Tax=Clostridium sp. BNL1100 TaxID=755731 RepID=UPI00024A7F23|nr:hypothetical protein [Clostridium sp. BNL1100]AEY65436.1 hypothetical protein Clo1100_1184 [Clostridium sp. BNL1100]
MPFGFERKQYEEQLKSEDNLEKLYLEVNATYLLDGSIRPISFIWEDDQKYVISKVIDCTPGQSLKNYTAGLKYKCQVGNKNFSLFFETDTTRWYILK